MKVIALPGVKASPARSTVRLPYIKRYKDRHGHLRQSFRRPGFAKVVLPGVPGSKEFMAVYCAAMAMAPVVPIAAKPAAVKQSRIAVGTVSAAIEAYQRSRDFASLAAATAGPRRRVLHQFAERSHGLALAKVTTAAIKEVIEARPAGTGKRWLNAIRAMFDYAIASGQFAGPNPCDRLSIRIPKSAGYDTWTEAQIAQYEARHPIGSPARRLFTLALFTGQRCSDLVKMGQSNFNDEGKLVVTQQKTGAVVKIPVCPALAEVLAASGPDIAPTFILGEKGTKISAVHADFLFRRWCREAGLGDRLKLHGLRKAICRRFVALGMTPHQIMAITGHKTLSEIQRYCDDFARETAGDQAMAALAAGYGR